MITAHLTETIVPGRPSGPNPEPIGTQNRYKNATAPLRLFLNGWQLSIPGSRKARPGMTR